ncbi:hypothetical protein ACWEN6_13480 [Sphaerisporangium sp. NPDC004334]
MRNVIIPGPPMRYGLRLVAYAANGAKLGPLPDHLGFEAAFPLDDVPSLRLSYSQHAPGAARLADPCEIAVEYSAGGPWIEPPDGRFLRVKRNVDHTDEAGTSSYTCPGYAWMAQKLVLYPGGLMVEGKRQFNAVTPGAILRTILDEGHARGTLPGMTAGFSATTDSAGQPWAAALTLALDPGVTLLATLINLADQGVINWQMQGRSLRVYNADTTLNRDLAAGPAPVDLRFGRDISEAPDDATMEDVSSAILIAGENGLQVEVTNPAALIPWGRWETFQQQGGVSDAGTAQLLGDAALQRASAERVQLTRGLTLQAARWLPLVHYRPGDLVLAPGGRAVMEPLRVRQVTVTCDGDGVLSGNLLLNDRFIERDIRLARRAAGILDGGVGSGGAGVTPAPETGGRTAAAPAGLVVLPAAFVDTAGYPRGQITATWAPVLADVDGVAIDVDSYELYGRRNLVGEPWQLVATTTSSDTTASYSPVDVNTEYGFKVRASAEGVKGEFSDAVAVLVPDDTTPPPVPTTPVVTSRLGVIEVAWDGLGEGGIGMPLDFDKVRVWMQPLPDPDPVEMGHLTAPGSIVITGQPYGQDRVLWLTSHDRSGNASAPSGSVTISTKALVDTDLIGKIIDGAEHIIDGSIPAEAKLVAGSITAGLIQALAIEAGHLAANAVTADKIAAGTIDAFHIKANAITADKVAADAIDGKTITGAYLRTAASGRRIELAPPGATLPEIRMYPGTGGNHAKIVAGGGGGSGIEILGEASAFGQRYAVRVAEGGMRITYSDAAGNEDIGGQMFCNTDEGAMGYFGDTSDQENFHFYQSDGTTVHIGRWQKNHTSFYRGMFVGAVTIGSGFVGINVGYGTSLMSEVIPIATVHDLSISGNPTYDWVMTARSSSGFSIDWSNASTTSKEICYVAFRV